jgi:ABC-type nickel/cobalt efflux system permease component RcnA
LFILRDLNNLIEAYFYMDIFNETFTLVAAIVISLITTLIQSALAIILLKSNGSMDLKTAINSHVKTMKNYPLRITTAVLVYFPVYLHLAYGIPLRGSDIHRPKKSPLNPLILSHDTG